MSSSIQSPVLLSQKKMDSMVSITSKRTDGASKYSERILSDHNNNKNIVGLRSSEDKKSADEMRARSTGSSKFTQKLDQKGVLKPEDDCLAPHLRKAAEDALRRSSSLVSLSSNFQNLSQCRGSLMNLSISGSEKSSTLYKFKSFSGSKTSRNEKSSERQAVLDRLNKLRDSLHSSKNFYPSRESSRSNSRKSTPTAPLSPSPSTVTLRM